VQTITTKGGTVLNVATRADLVTAVPTAYLRAYPKKGKIRIIYEEDGDQTVIFADDLAAVAEKAHSLEVRLRKHALIPVEKIPLDDAQVAARRASEEAAERG
jgi:hypothetical protein